MFADRCLRRMRQAQSLKESLWLKRNVSSHPPTVPRVLRPPQRGPEGPRERRVGGSGQQAGQLRVIVGRSAASGARCRALGLPVPGQMRAQAVLVQKANRPESRLRPVARDVVFPGRCPCAGAGLMDALAPRSGDRKLEHEAVRNIFRFILSLRPLPWPSARRPAAQRGCAVSSPEPWAPALHLCQPVAGPSCPPLNITQGGAGYTC